MVYKVDKNLCLPEKKVFFFSLNRGVTYIEQFRINYVNSCSSSEGPEGTRMINDRQNFVSHYSDSKGESENFLNNQIFCNL